MDYQGKNVLVVGMARSGVAAAKLLASMGAHVFLYDKKTREQLPAGCLDALEGLPFTDRLGSEPLEYIGEMDCLVLSPGVPLSLPFLRKAEELGKVVISEIELGFQCAQADFVCITGTNGKTTTTALTGQIFKDAGYHTFVLGNIGIPITQEAPSTKPGDVIVAETAALQLDTIDTYRPKCSAILNFTEDHLDRYHTMENYIAAKKRIFENQTADDFCILNYDNDLVRAVASEVRAQILWFSTQVVLEEGAFVEDGNIVFCHAGRKQVVLPEQEVRIPGRHNLENALAATALAAVYGVPICGIAQTLRAFPGVEHRIEFVREVNGVTFINDSKGTNPDATQNAIRAMQSPTVLILGGYDKKSDFRPLFDCFDGKVCGVVVLGATTEQILQTAEECGFHATQRADTLQDAVRLAYAQAPKGGTVLLSPACASWDMFRDFEQRGEMFKEIVKGLN